MLTTEEGQTLVKDCSNCTIAWLYKDAHQFGIDTYKMLVGTDNVICDQIGPVLETDDQDFINQMNSCPGHLKQHKNGKIVF